MSWIGFPRVHYRVTSSTNERARELAGRGAPHGTLVTAAAQSAGRGRQGRTWWAPPGRAILCSLVVRTWDELLPLRAGLAAADLTGSFTTIKWPNDVLLHRRKVAGILVEARPQDGWAVVGIGVNVAVRPEDLPEDLRARAGSMGMQPSAIEPALRDLIDLLAGWLASQPTEVIEEVNGRDALWGQPISWAGGAGVGAGIDDRGRLLVQTAAGRVALDAGEVHLSADLY